MPCTVVLARHGFTYWNARKKMQGQVNIPLNDEGRRQAHELHDQLSGIDFDVCYSSPLVRAVETAKIALDDPSVPIVKDERLLEHSYGLLEGRSYRHTPWFYLTNPANGPLLTAHRDNSDSSNLSDVLDMEGNVLLRRLGSCYIPDDLPDDCFIARQGFDYGLMDSTGQWLYRESIFSSPSDDAGGGYLY